MLFHGARADAQLPGDSLVAALDQQVEHLVIARRNFDCGDIHHYNSPSLSFVEHPISKASRCLRLGARPGAFR